MTKDTHTPTRPIRIDPELWARFGAQVGERNRSEVIRAFVLWVLRERGGQLPERAPQGTSRAHQAQNSRD